MMLHEYAAAGAAHESQYLFLFGDGSMPVRISFMSCRVMRLAHLFAACTVYHRVSLGGTRLASRQFVA